MNNFNKKQVNLLLTGVSLATELNPSDINFRCFLTIMAYEYNKQGEFTELTKFLKNYNQDEIYFLIKKYEIGNDYIKNSWDVTEEDVMNLIVLEDIKGLKNLEIELLKLMNDLSTFRPTWDCENPL